MASGSSKVPGIGNKNAKIMLVGEAPGKDEDEEGEPFVGVSGQLLMRYLNRHGVDREDVWLTNLCKYRPPKNKFVQVDPEKLKEGLEELKQEIHEVKPNVIVALGAWPLWYLTGKSGKNPGTGIDAWRSTWLPYTGWEGDGIPPKVMPTYHPAYVLRTWSVNAWFHFDLGKAIREQGDRELRYPRPESIINPPRDQLTALLDKMYKSPWISVDIETFPNGTFSCVGFTDSTEYGVCVNYQAPELFGLVREMWESPTPKIFQFGTYDTLFMKHFYGWNSGGFYGENGEIVGWDTYIAGALLQPEFPKNLNFLTGLYSRMPYYKEDRKQWKETGDMTSLWEYNVKDVVVTLEIALGQMKDLADVYPGGFR